MPPRSALVPHTHRRSRAPGRPVPRPRPRRARGGLRQPILDVGYMGHRSHRDAGRSLRRSAGARNRDRRTADRGLVAPNAAHMERVASHGRPPRTMQGPERSTSESAPAAGLTGSTTGWTRDTKQPTLRQAHGHDATRRLGGPGRILRSEWIIDCAVGDEGLGRVARFCAHRPSTASLRLARDTYSRCRHHAEGTCLPTAGTCSSWTLALAPRVHTGATSDVHAHVSPYSEYGHHPLPWPPGLKRARPRPAELDLVLGWGAGGRSTDNDAEPTTGSAPRVSVIRAR
jgi:hypothetical protein